MKRVRRPQRLADFRTFFFLEASFFLLPTFLILRVMIAPYFCTGVPKSFSHAWVSSLIAAGDSWTWMPPTGR